MAYYYYRGDQVKIAASPVLTVVGFVGKNIPSVFQQPVKGKKEIQFYSKRNHTAVLKLPFEKAKAFVGPEDKELDFFPVYTYEGDKQFYSGYRPIVFNGQYLVKFKKGVKKDTASAICEKYGGILVKRFKGAAELYLVRHVNKTRNFLDSVNLLYEENKNEVEFAHPDFVNGQKTEAPPQHTADQQNVLLQLNVIEAWNRIETMRNTAGLVLQPVSIAVLDDGIYDPHTDLKDIAASERFNMYPGDPCPIRNIKNNHGTAVAGIINAISDPNFITGVAYEAKLVDVRTSLEEGGIRETTTEIIVDGLQAAIDAKVKVINISWSHHFVDAIESKIKEALSKGIVVCCAAGNYKRNESQTVLFPGTLAGSTDVITVGACDATGKIIDFPDNNIFGSRRGAEVTVYAPGINIATLKLNGSLYMTNFSGTSAATAFVSGIVALLRAVDPGLTPAQIKNILITSRDANKVPNTLSATNTALS